MLVIEIIGKDTEIKKRYETFNEMDFFDIMSMIAKNFYLKDNEEIFTINEQEHYHLGDFIDSLTLKTRI